MNEKKSRNIKKRNWAFVLYPESAPENWIEQLEQTGLQVAISPLHDKDLNADGEPKKAHYHVILAYSGPTSFNVVKALCDGLNCPIPQALEQIKGYYRYLTHKDNPEKAQYSDDDIRTLNGFDIREYVELTATEVSKISLQLQQLIIEHDIIEYCDLMDLLLENGMSDEYDVARRNTLFFDRYITSRRNKQMYGSKAVVDTETGEVIKSPTSTDK